MECKVTPACNYKCVQLVVRTMYLFHRPAKVAIVVGAAINSVTQTATHNANMFTIVNIHLFVPPTLQNVHRNISVIYR